MPTALITGASQGIGKATALAFARRKWDLTLTYKTNVGDVMEECRKAGSVNVRMVHLNLEASHSISNLERYVIQQGRIDALVNNGSIIDWTPFPEMTLAQIEAIINTNLLGTMLLTRILAPYVNQSIVNVASDVGHAGNIHAGLLAYSVSKAGVLAFTEGLAQLVPKLKVKSVSPAKTATRMNDGEGQDINLVAEEIFNVATA
jgi:NAD(P)-dependent dehydrogenase (short-subunit alcohol dehydrogenase family)